LVSSPRQRSGLVVKPVCLISWTLRSGYSYIFMSQ
jgi:hypothetical protein